jgi:hypothetical protein
LLSGRIGGISYQYLLWLLVISFASEFVIEIPAHVLPSTGDGLTQLIYVGACSGCLMSRLLCGAASLLRCLSGAYSRFCCHLSGFGSILGALPGILGSHRRGLSVDSHCFFCLTPVLLIGYSIYCCCRAFGCRYP